MLSTETAAKHNIKRVNSFLGSRRFEGHSVARGLFQSFASQEGPVLVLADWTDVSNGFHFVQRLSSVFQVDVECPSAGSRS